MSDPVRTTVMVPSGYVQMVVTVSPENVTKVASGQGPSGPAGPPGSDLTGIAGVTLNGHRAVAWESSQLVHANCSDPAHLFSIAGVIEFATVAGESVPVKSSGVVEYSGWSWVSGPVWYGVDGELTQTQPDGYPRVIGRGDGQRLFIDIQPPVQVI